MLTARQILIAGLVMAAAIPTLPQCMLAAPRRDSPLAPGKLAAQPNQVRGDEITEAQQQSVTRGLEWLSKHQKPDGSYGGDGMAPHAGITALAGLAFMQAGNLPGRGKYGDNVSRCLDFVLTSCQESGLIASDQSHGPMYGHGFAALFLAEVYGMTGDERVKDRLQRAIRLIQKTQNPEGGWRYQPVPFDADISVTICQVMALRAARDAGIKVEKEVIDKAIKYVRNCQNPDGGFSYMARQGGGGGSGWARSAAGVSALYYAGVFEGEDLNRGLKYIMRFVPTRAGVNPQMEGHYWYGNYYAVQATFLAGGDYWAKWYPAARDEIISKQNKTSGSWTGDFSEDYATSMALIVLQMPNRYLPVYTGKGAGLVRRISHFVSVVARASSPWASVHRRRSTVRSKQQSRKQHNLASRYFREFSFRPSVEPRPGTVAHGLEARTTKTHRQFNTSAPGTRLFVVAVLLLGGIVASSARAQSAWILTTADFRTQVVTLKKLDDTGVHLMAPGPSGTAPSTQSARQPAGERIVPMDQFLLLQRATPKVAVPDEAAASRFVLVLADGDRMAGEPVSTAGETLTWNSRALGETPVSLRQVTSIVRAGIAIEGAAPANADAAEPALAEDVVILGNGDSVRGIISDINATSVTIQPDGAAADASEIPWDSVLEVRFASTYYGGTSRAQAPKRSFRVSLTDGSAISVEHPVIGEDRILHLPRATGHGERTVPLDAVVAIEHVNGPVIWLSSLVPSEIVQTPFLDLGWPTRFDTAVDGGAIRAGAAVFSRGIGVHSYSRVVFPIDQTCRAFRTQFAIATPGAAGTEDAAPFADVTVRVRLDGKTVYEKAGVRASSGLSEVVSLETRGAATLTLEVDFGLNHDVQDRFNWIEPALLRFVPKAPASKPTAPSVARPSSAPNEK